MLSATGECDACGPSPRCVTKYPAFLILSEIAPDTQWSQAITNVNYETSSFWNNYVSGGVDWMQLEKSLKNLKASDVNRTGSRDPLLVYLKGRSDTQALKYLHSCLRYNEACGNPASWDYDEPDMGALRTLNSEIVIPASGPFRNRMALLKMQVLFKLDDYAGVHSIWTQYGVPLLRECENIDSYEGTAPLCRRMLGYEAGAQYHQKNYADALDTYLMLGDSNSAIWCIGNLAGLSNLKHVAQTHPRSAATLYVLQDYVNYLCSPAPLHDEDWEEIDPAPLRREFVEYAASTARSGNVVAPRAWMWGAALVAAINGDTATARKLLSEGDSMKGDDCANCLDKCRHQIMAVIDFKSIPTDRDADRRFAMELDNLLALAIKEKGSAYNEWDHQNYAFFQDLLLPMMSDTYAAANRHDLMALVIAMCDYNGFDPISYESLSTFEEYALFNASLLELYNIERACETAEQNVMIPVIAQDGNDVEEAYAKTMCKMAHRCGMNSNRLNDLIGTRLLRSEDWRGALSYFEKVEPEWYALQPTFRWLNGRSVESAPMFGRSQYAPHPIGAPRNFKADYCRRLIALNDEVQAAQGEEELLKKCELANLLFQGSELGDLWAISNYSWTYSAEKSSVDKNDRPLTYQAYQKLCDAYNDAINSPELQNTRGLAMVCYGMAALPASGDLKMPITLTYAPGDYDKQIYYFYAASPRQKEAFNYLKTHLSALPDRLRSCDVVQSYSRRTFTQYVNEY